MDFNEFAEKVKAKYPQYADKDNQVLAEAMVKKYPEYASKVTFEPVKNSVGSFAKLIGNISLELHKDVKDKVLDASALPKKAMQTFGTALSNVKELGPTGALADAAANVMKPNFQAEGVGENVAELGASVADPRMLGLGAALKPVGNAKKLGATLEAMGAKAQNFTAGLRPQTLEAMTRSGQNPADVGVKVGSQLAKEKIIGATPKETFDNLLKAHRSAGQEVANAIRNIHKNGRAAVNADAALEPLLAKVNELKGSITGTRRNMTKHFDEVLKYFKKQSGQDGMLSLDEVKKAMKEIGPLTNKGSDEVQQVMSELYGTLANVQDQIITSVAKQAKNPALKEALLKANQRFSLFARVRPDLEAAAAREGAGKSSFLAAPIESMKKGAASLASGVLTRTGRQLQGFPAAEQGTNRAALDSVMSRLKNAQ